MDQELAVGLQGGGKGTAAVVGLAQAAAKMTARLSFLFSFEQLFIEDDRLVERLEPVVDVGQL